MMSSNNEHETSRLTQQIEVLEMLHEIMLEDEAKVEAKLEAIENLIQAKMNMDYVRANR